MKNPVLSENDFLPGDLERQIGTFVDHCNNRRYHESLDNLTPADVYHGRSANSPEDEREDQETDNPETPVAASGRRRLNSNRNRTRASVTNRPKFSENL